MTTADEARYRGILILQSFNSLLLLFCVLALVATGPRLYEGATILREERQAWQEYRQGEIERERQQRERLEALRNSQIRDALPPHPTAQP